MVAEGRAQGFDTLARPVAFTAVHPRRAYNIPQTIAARKASAVAGRSHCVIGAPPLRTASAGRSPGACPNVDRRAAQSRRRSPELIEPVSPAARHEAP